jgi:hypothetical protein
MSEELKCWYCGEIISNPNDVYKMNIDESNEAQHWHKKCAEEHGMAEESFISGDTGKTYIDYINKNSISISEEKAIDYLRIFAWINLIAGIIGAIVIWSTIGTTGVLNEANPIGISLGFVSLIGGFLGWALLLVICSVAKNLIEINKTLMEEYHSLE